MIRYVYACTYVGVRCINIRMYTAAAKTMQYIDIIHFLCLLLCLKLSISIYMHLHYKLGTQIIIMYLLQLT